MHKHVLSQTLAKTHPLLSHVLYHFPDGVFKRREQGWRITFMKRTRLCIVEPATAACHCLGCRNRLNSTSSRRIRYFSLARKTLFFRMRNRRRVLQLQRSSPSAFSEHRLLVHRRP